MSYTTRWWLLRHSPVINPQRHIYGQRDVEADTHDEAPFRALAAALPRDAVWLTTTLTRTKRTAQAIREAWAGGDAPADAPRAIPELIEQSFGDWQGMTHDEIRERYPRSAHRFWVAPATERPPGGESFVELVARVSPTLQRLSEEYAGRDVVAVVHGGTIRAALAMALGVDAERVLAFRIDTLSLTRLDAISASPIAWRVAGVNLPPGSLLQPE